jgi:hypothetical protein
MLGNREKDKGPDCSGPHHLEIAELNYCRKIQNRAEKLNAVIVDLAICHNDY